LRTAALGNRISLGSEGNAYHLDGPYVRRIL
jgi:hypothetical protein